MTNHRDPQQNNRNQIREGSRWQAERRDEMAVHGLRSLLLLNGGGAVALLAFLQSVWIEPTAQELVPWVVAGMIPLLLGAATSGWVHFVRYETTEVYQMKGRAEGQEMTRKHKAFTKVGFALFLLGMGIVVLGALLNLPGVAPASSAP